jgi:putative redox protein
MRFQGRSPKGTTVTMESGGTDGAAGPSPMETVLIALAGCSAVDVVGILEKMRVAVQALRIDVEGQRADEPPRVFRKIHLRYIARGDGLTADQLQRAVALSVDKYCSVAAMLGQSAELSTEAVVEP